MIIFVIGLMYVYPNIMLNPGDLETGHQNVSSDCFACHKPFWGISNEKCISCHKISEIGLRKSDSTKVIKILFHQSLTHQECTACHTDHIGINPLNSTSKFSHEHVSENVISNCNSCHEFPSVIKHAKYKSECKNCHTTNKWTQVQNFKHESIVESEINNCSSCHNNPGDKLHSGISENCGVCHSTFKWKPSTFDHSTKFILDSDHNTTCNTCHTYNNFKTYTCYGCHEHSLSKITSEHIEEGINNFENCVSCHKSANEDDVKGGKDENDNDRRKNIENDDDD